MFEGAALNPSEHLVRMTAVHPRAALIALEDALGATGASLSKLSLNPVGDKVEVRLRLCATDEATARRLGERLADCLGVRSVSIEHWCPAL
jgi:hypothetical protein